MNSFKKMLGLVLIFNCFMARTQSPVKQNTEWSVGSSIVKFKIKNAGITVSGSFSGLTAKIIFDATKNNGNSISATVDAKTIDTDNKTRDGHLKKAEYFDVEKYPKISLVSTLFGKAEDNGFRGYFNVTIKDKSKAVTIPFTFVEKNGTAVFNGSFILNRLDFGVGESSIILSDKVTVEIEVNANRK